jgi:hypothetical protein
VRVGRRAEGNEKRRPPGRREFAERRGSGPADDDVRPCQLVEEPWQERLEPPSGRKRAIEGGSRGKVFLSGLVDHLEALARKSLGRGRHRSIQDDRALASTEHQNAGRRAVGRDRRNREELGAHRRPGHHGRPREARARLLPAHRGARGDAAQKPVGEPGLRVGVVDQRRDCERARGDDDRDAHVPAHSRHGACLRRPKDPPGAEEPRREGRERAELVERTLPHEAGRRHEFERKAGFRDQPRLEAAGRSDE